jgi:hypothetical protein
MSETLQHLDARIGTDSDGNNYYIVFCSRDSDNSSTKPGHAFVVWGVENGVEGISSEKAFGFYPNEDSDENEALFTEATGAIVNEATKNTPSNLLTARLIVRVNKDAFTASQDEILVWKTTDYNLFGDHCIKFAHAVAVAAGLFPPEVGTFTLPTTYLNELIQNSKARFGGSWKSTDADQRFTIAIDGPTAAWTEKRANGVSHTRNVDLQHTTEWTVRLNRPNDEQVLIFLDFPDATLRAEILAAHPEASFITLINQGDKIIGEWHGLLVKKLPNGHLNELVQPSQIAPKTFEFVNA